MTMYFSCPFGFYLFVLIFPSILKKFVVLGNDSMDDRRENLGNKTIVLIIDYNLEPKVDIEFLKS